MYNQRYTNSRYTKACSGVEYENTLLTLESLECPTEIEAIK